MPLHYLTSEIILDTRSKFWGTSDIINPFLAVWIIWPGLVPDEPDGWTFPDASPSASTGIGAECKEGTGTGDAKSEDADTGTVKGLGVDYEVKYIVSEKAAARCHALI